MKVLIVAGVPDVPIEEKFDKYIGVDYGSLWLIENQLPLDLAVGDFDSVSNDEFEKISENALEMIRLHAEKDETDFEVALSEAVTKFPDAEYMIIGALGGRLDHQLANIYLPTTEKFSAFAPRMTLINQQNTVKYLFEGQHKLQRVPERKYIGFVQIDATSKLTIENAKYPLRAEKNFATIYASNEFIDETMSVNCSKGMLIAIYSADIIA